MRQLCGAAQWALLLSSKRALPSGRRACTCARVCAGPALAQPRNSCNKDMPMRLVFVCCRRMAWLIIHSTGELQTVHMDKRQLVQVRARHVSTPASLRCVFHAPARTQLQGLAGADAAGPACSGNDSGRRCPHKTCVCVCHACTTGDGAGDPDA